MAPKKAPKAPKRTVDDVNAEFAPLLEQFLEEKRSYTEAIEAAEVRAAELNLESDDLAEQEFTNKLRLENETTSSKQRCAAHTARLEDLRHICRTATDAAQLLHSQMADMAAEANALHKATSRDTLRTAQLEKERSEFESGSLDAEIERLAAAIAAQEKRIAGTDRILHEVTAASGEYQRVPSYMAANNTPFALTTMLSLDEVVPKNIPTERVTKLRDALVDRFGFHPVEHISPWSCAPPNCTTATDIATHQRVMDALWGCTLSPHATIESSTGAKQRLVNVVVVHCPSVVKRSVAADGSSVPTVFLRFNSSCTTDGFVEVPLSTFISTVVDRAAVPNTLLVVDSWGAQVPQESDVGSNRTPLEQTAPFCLMHSPLFRENGPLVFEYCNSAAERRRCAEHWSPHTPVPNGLLIQTVLNLLEHGALNNQETCTLPQQGSLFASRIRHMTSMSAAAADATDRSLLSMSDISVGTGTPTAEAPRVDITWLREECRLRLERVHPNALLKRISSIKTAAGTPFSFLFSSSSQTVHQPLTRRVAPECSLPLQYAAPLHQGVSMRPHPWSVVHPSVTAAPLLIPSTPVLSYEGSMMIQHQVQPVVEGATLQDRASALVVASGPTRAAELAKWRLRTSIRVCLHDDSAESQPDVGVTVDAQRVEATTTYEAQIQLLLSLDATAAAVDTNPDKIQHTASLLGGIGGHLRRDLQDTIRGAICDAITTEVDQGRLQALATALPEEQTAYGTVTLSLDPSDHLNASATLRIEGLSLTHEEQLTPYALHCLVDDSLRSAVDGLVLLQHGHCKVQTTGIYHVFCEPQQIKLDIANIKPAAALQVQQHMRKFIDDGSISLGHDATPRTRYLKLKQIIDPHTLGHHAENKPLFLNATAEYQLQDAVHSTSQHTSHRSSQRVVLLCQVAHTPCRRHEAASDVQWTAKLRQAAGGLLANANAQMLQGILAVHPSSTIANPSGVDLSAAAAGGLPPALWDHACAAADDANHDGSLVAVLYGMSSHTEVRDGSRRMIALRTLVTPNTGNEQRPLLTDALKTLEELLAEPTKQEEQPDACREQENGSAADEKATEQPPTEPKVADDPKATDEQHQEAAAVEDCIKPPVDCMNEDGDVAPQKN